MLGNKICKKIQWDFDSFHSSKLVAHYSNSVIRYSYVIIIYGPVYEN